MFGENQITLGLMFHYTVYIYIYRIHVTMFYIEQ